MALNFRLNFDRSVAGQMRAAAARGLLLGAEHVLTEAQNLVPLDESALQNTGTPSVDKGSLTAMVSYDTPYAARQHEELDWRHAPGRQAKYLEQPLNAERATVLDLVAAQMRRALR